MGIEAIVIFYLVELILCVIVLLTYKHEKEIEMSQQKLREKQEELIAKIEEINNKIRRN